MPMYVNAIYYVLCQGPYLVGSVTAVHNNLEYFFSL